MKYLLEMYRNEQLVDKKYAYTIEELREWYNSLYASEDYIYYLFEVKDLGTYFEWKKEEK